MKREENPLRKYKGLVNSIRIDHAAYKEIFERLVEACDDVGTTATPICLHIAGESRTGKSCVVNDFLDQYRPIRGQEGLQQTVVYAVAPEKATVKALLHQLLYGLKDPHWARGSVANMSQRLLLLLEGVGCRLIILDELQHLCDKGQNVVLKHAADWLKTLVESKKWGLVAVGMPESASVIHRNAQLAWRFDATMTMPLFDWADASSRKQFKGILKAFVEELKPFELPRLDSDEMGLRTYLATNGRVGMFAKIMDEAVRAAIRRRSTEIRTEDLAIAFDRAVWYAPRFPLAGGPFRADFELCRPNAIALQVAELARQEEYQDNSATVSVTTLKPDAVYEGPRKPGRPMTKKRLQAEMARAL